MGRSDPVNHFQPAGEALRGPTWFQSQDTMNSSNLRIFARLLLLVLVLIGMATAAAAIWVWRHRRQIASALVAATAAAYVAGAWCRRQLVALAEEAATLTHDQPVAAIAPISAALEAIAKALDALVVSRLLNEKGALRPPFDLHNSFTQLAAFCAPMY